MTRIGDKEVVYQATLVQPDGTPSEMDFSVGVWSMKLRIRFIPDKKEGEGSISWTQTDEGLNITFNGFDNPIGSAARAPIRIGAAGTGENLGFIFCHHKIGNVNRLDFLLLLGGSYE